VTEEQNDRQQDQPHDATGGGKQPEQGQRTFTQDQLDAILADRLARERTRFADYDDLKVKAAKLAELEQAQMSELEKATARAQALEAERDRALARANETLVRSAFIAEAAKLGVVHPEDAFALSDASGVVVGEDGKVSGVTEAVAALVEAGRLPMTTRPQAPNLDGGAGSGARQGDKPKSLTPEELEMARKMGLTPEQYALGKKT